MIKYNLRLHLIMIFIVIAVVIAVASSYFAFKKGTNNLDEFFDNYQVVLAKQIASINWTARNIIYEKQTKSLIKVAAYDYEESEEAYGYALFDKDGKMVIHDNRNGHKFNYVSDYEGFDNQIIDNKKWRVYFYKSTNKNFTIAVGQDAGYRRTVARFILKEVLFPWGFGLLFFIFLFSLILNHEFLKIKTFSKQISQRNYHDLSPIIMKRLPKEIAPLIYSINRLLSRVEEMKNRERSFLSDAAHELRSPLTALKVQLDVALMSDKDAKKRTNALKKLSIGIDRSSRLVEQLLALSKLETIKRDTSLEQQIDFENIVNEIISSKASEIYDKNLFVNFQYLGNPPIEQGCPILVALLVRNLVDNAVKYSPDGANIVIVIKDNKLTITNSNTTVNEAYLPRLEERFFRPPGQKENGSGLGIPIVKRIANIYDCDLIMENTDEGFKVTIRKASK